MRLNICACAVPLIAGTKVVTICAVHACLQGRPKRPRKRFPALIDIMTTIEESSSELQQRASLQLQAVSPTQTLRSCGSDGGSNSKAYAADEVNSGMMGPGGLDQRISSTGDSSSSSSSRINGVRSSSGSSSNSSNGDDNAEGVGETRSCDDAADSGALLRGGDGVVNGEAETGMPIGHTAAASPAAQGEQDQPLQQRGKAGGSVAGGTLVAAQPALPALPGAPASVAEHSSGSQGSGVLDELLASSSGSDSARAAGADRGVVVASTVARNEAREEQQLDGAAEAALPRTGVSPTVARKQALRSARLPTSTAVADASRAAAAPVPALQLAPLASAHGGTHTSDSDFDRHDVCLSVRLQDVLSHQSSSDGGSGRASPKEIEAKVASPRVPCHLQSTGLREVASTPEVRAAPVPTALHDATSESHRATHSSPRPEVQADKSAMRSDAAQLGNSSTAGRGARVAASDPLAGSIARSLLQSPEKHQPAAFTPPALILPADLQRKHTAAATPDFAPCSPRAARANLRPTGATTAGQARAQRSSVADVPMAAAAISGMSKVRAAAAALEASMQRATSSLTSSAAVLRPVTPDSQIARIAPSSAGTAVRTPSAHATTAMHSLAARSAPSAVTQRATERSSSFVCAAKRAAVSHCGIPERSASASTPGSAIASTGSAVHASDSRIPQRPGAAAAQRLRSAVRVASEPAQSPAAAVALQHEATPETHAAAVHTAAHQRSGTRAAELVVPTSGQEKRSGVERARRHNADAQMSGAAFEAAVRLTAARERAAQVHITPGGSGGAAGGAGGEPHSGGGARGSVAASLRSFAGDLSSKRKSWLGW